jgi:hypothetical protein
LFVPFSYKQLLQCSFYENRKNAKIDFSAKKSKKFVYYNENMNANSKFQRQLSRKLQQFRRCRKNKKCSIFHKLSEYQQKVTTFFQLDLSLKISQAPILGPYVSQMECACSATKFQNPISATTSENPDYSVLVFDTENERKSTHVCFTSKCSSATGATKFCNYATT